MKKKISYNNPVQVINTNSWKKECLASLIKMNVHNPLIITSKGSLKREKLSELFDHKSIFSAVEPNPTFETCQNAIDFSRANEVDGLVAIGGGSVMDSAKAVVASMSTCKYNCKELLSGENQYIKKIPNIFIPTTCGTGSEVTMFSTIWDFKETKKYSLTHPSLYPDVAILDASTILSLPLESIIIHLLDALSHGFEALWNKNTNSKSTEYAIKSISMIIDSKLPQHML